MWVHYFHLNVNYSFKQFSTRPEALVNVLSTEIKQLSWLSWNTGHLTMNKRRCNGSFILFTLAYSRIPEILPSYYVQHIDFSCRLGILKILI
jgi:hypothetical protein